MRSVGGQFPAQQSQTDHRGGRMGMSDGRGERPYGRQALTIELGAGLVRYQVQGEGDPLVLVHGLAGSSAWWVRNIGPLSRYYKVYLIDLPGFGSMRKHR